MKNNDLLDKILSAIIPITSKNIGNYDEMAKETRDAVAKFVEKEFPFPSEDQQKYKKAFDLIVDNITYTSLALIKTIKNSLNGFIEALRFTYTK